MPPESHSMKGLLLQLPEALSAGMGQRQPLQVLPQLPRAASAKLRLFLGQPLSSAWCMNELKGPTKATTGQLRRASVAAESPGELKVAVLRAAPQLNFYF